MHAITAFLAAAVLLLSTSGSLQAQLPQPPAALKKLDVLLGTWEGSGSARMTADTDPAPWTARATVKPILRGFALQEDWVIQVGGPVPLAFRTVYSYDTHTESFRYAGFSNMGFIGTGRIHVMPDGSIVRTEARDEGGVIMSDHEISKFEGDTWKFASHRSIGATGTFFVHVEGSMKRKGGKEVDVTDVENLQLLPAGEQISGLAALAGKWKYTGWIIPFPGAPKTPISGKSASSMILGGHAHLIEVMGGEIPGLGIGYNANVYVVWDARERAYRSVGFENLGGMSDSLGHRIGANKVVYTGSVLYMGTPIVNRSTLEWNAEGTRQTITTDSCASDQPCARVFEATYERMKQEKKREEDL